MDILYLLIPLSSVLVLLILGIFAWALQAGQFDDLAQQAEQIMDGVGEPLDSRQPPPATSAQQSSP
ncbi:MAG: cbb3-type cytochrome oxidase assembly protein CcoS [Rhizobiales bacterium]|nr:cbb3-type cytochrome oxidase assembly protein CcoS [Hyphomicrobiales bacterium]